MTRTFTGLCIASAFAFAATAAAQSGTSTTASQSTQAAGHEVSVTGCLAKAGDGTYMLTNARVEPAGSASSSASTPSTTTTGSATTTAGAATGTTGTSATSPATSAMSNDTTWTLQGGTDLDKHVGHKIQVTGNATWSSSEHSSNGFSSTGAATASTGSTTASGATGTTGTTAGTSGSVTGGEQRTPSASSTSNSHPRLDVQSVKMVASSCS